MKMKRFCCLTTAILLFAFAGNAQLLWKVSGNGLSKPSYILGTHHHAPSKFIEKISGFDEAITTCDEIYGEVEKSDLTGPEAQAAIMQKVMAPADSTLSKVLKPKTIAALDSILKAGTGGVVSINQLDMLIPTFVSTQILLLVKIELFPENATDEGIDIAVQKRGAELNKPTNGFETLEFQMNLIYGKPIADQAESLDKMMEKFDKNKESIAKLYNAYTEKDLKKLHEITMQEIEEDDSTPEEKEQSMREMFTDRNKNWVNKLKTLMPEKSIFTVVGAGHLPGTDGLIDLLQKEGYTVEPMK